MKRATVGIIGIVALFLVGSIYLLSAQNSGDDQGNYSIRRAQLSGGAKLIDGSVEVKFEEGSFSSASDIRVIATPVGSWSGIFIKDINGTGFTAVSETGNPNAEFSWIAVGEIKEPPMSIYRDAIPPQMNK